MKSVKEAMRLYAVTAEYRDDGLATAECVRQALSGGATCIQLREKEADKDKFLKDAIEVKGICKSFGVPFIVNDNAEVAVKSGADGLHIGQHDIKLAEAKKYTSGKILIGVSVQTPEQAMQAERDGADYLGIGAVFATSTKNDADFVTYETLKEICRCVEIPVVAIGGICKDNIHRLCGSGIDGIAAVSAIFAAENIKIAATELKNIVDEALEKGGGVI